MAATLSPDVARVVSQRHVTPMLRPVPQLVTAVSVVYETPTAAELRTEAIMARLATLAIACEEAAA